jgi:hypothetical protein
MMTDFQQFWFHHHGHPILAHAINYNWHVLTMPKSTCQLAVLNINAYRLKLLLDASCSLIMKQFDNNVKLLHQQNKVNYYTHWRLAALTNYACYCIHHLPFFTQYSTHS